MRTSLKIMKCIYLIELSLIALSLGRSSYAGPRDLRDSIESVEVKYVYTSGTIGFFEPKSRIQRNQASASNYTLHFFEQGREFTYDLPIEFVGVLHFLTENPNNLWGFVPDPDEAAQSEKLSMAIGKFTGPVTFGISGQKGKYKYIRVMRGHFNMLTTSKGVAIPAKSVEPDIIRTVKHDDGKTEIYPLIAKPEGSFGLGKMTLELAPPVQDYIRSKALGMKECLGLVEKFFRGDKKRRF